MGHQNKPNPIFRVRLIFNDPLWNRSLQAAVEYLQSRIWARLDTERSEEIELPDEYQKAGLSQIESYNLSPVKEQQKTKINRLI